MHQIEEEGSPEGVSLARVPPSFGGADVHVRPHSSLVPFTELDV